jgi:hypothetical protein
VRIVRDSLGMIADVLRIRRSVKRSLAVSAKSDTPASLPSRKSPPGEFS